MEILYGKGKRYGDSKLIDKNKRKNKKTSIGKSKNSRRRKG